MQKLFIKHKEWGWGGKGEKCPYDSSVYINLVQESRMAHNKMQILGNTLPLRKSGLVSLGHPGYAFL